MGNYKTPKSSATDLPDVKGPAGNISPDSFPGDTGPNSFGWGPVLAYPAETGILNQDAPSEAVYYIENGMVKLTRTDSTGQEVILGIRYRNWLIGAPAALLEKPYSFTVTTLTPCTLRRINTENFKGMMKTNSQFSFQVTRMLSLEIFAQAKNLSMMGFLPAGDRLKMLLCDIIFEMAQPPDLQQQVRLRLPLKQRELAQMIAVTPEHFCRLLKNLKHQGLVSREKDDLVVKDLKGLMICRGI